MKKIYNKVWKTVTRARRMGQKARKENYERLHEKNTKINGKEMRKRCMCVRERDTNKRKE